MWSFSGNLPLGCTSRPVSKASEANAEIAAPATTVNTTASVARRPQMLGGEERTD